MKTQPRLNGKWTLTYGIAIIVLVISIYYLTLPLNTKLRLFCTIDDAHLAQESPLWIPGYWRIQWTEWVNGYWVNPTTGANLTVITICEAIDAGTWLYYDNKENIFWIGVQTGPMKGEIYGPYQGILWELTKTIDPIATIGIILSCIVLLYPLIRRALPHRNRGNQTVQKTKVSAEHRASHISFSPIKLKPRVTVPSPQSIQRSMRRYPAPLHPPFSCKADCPHASQARACFCLESNMRDLHTTPRIRSLRILIVSNPFLRRFPKYGRQIFIISA